MNTPFIHGGHWPWLFHKQGSVCFATGHGPMSGGLGRKDSHRPRVKGYAWDLWHDRDTPDAKKNSVFARKAL